MTNKTIIYLLSILFVLSCRKQEFKTDTTGYKLITPCTNEIMDGTEIGTDCGGDCLPCEENTPPCTNPENKIRVLKSGIVQTLDVTETVLESDENGWIIKGYTEGSTTDFLSLTFPLKPDITHTYKGVFDPAYPENGEVWMKYKSFFATELEGNGEVFINFNEGTYYFTSCDCRFQAGGFVPDSTQWFNISFTP